MAPMFDLLVLDEATQATCTSSCIPLVKRELLPSRDEPMEAFNVGRSVKVDDHSRSNDTEARLVTYLVQELTDDRSPDEIAVITPYSAQVRTIEERLQEHLQNGHAVTVDTIDSFQGSEREAIVLSLVRSSCHGNIGFLGREQDGPRRLNVALTRAKRYCAVVADFHTLCYESSGKCTDLYSRFNRSFEDIDRHRDVDPDFIAG